MKFSVIVPVYNRAHCVAKTIESVIAQSYSDWELIAVDDGSTDNSLELLKELADREPRIKVIHQENKGVSAARNAGIEASTGEYILFLDSDDYMVPEAMKLLADSIVQYAEPDIICGGFRESSGGEWLPEGSICDKLYDREFIYKNILPEHVNVHPQTKCFLQPYIWNKCYKSSLLSEAKIRFDENRRTWEDNVFFVACLAASESAVIRRFALAEYRDSGKNDHLSHTLTPDLLYGYIKSYAEYKQQFGGIYNFNNQYTNTRYFTYLCDILYRLRERVPEEEYGRVVDNVLNDGNVAFWLKNLKPKSFVDLRIKLAYRAKDKQKLVKLLESKARLKAEGGIFKRLWRRVRGMLSRIKRMLLKR